MAICGWCRGEGKYNGKTCVCTQRRRAYFAKQKAKPAAQYAFPRAHKCGPEVQEFLQTVKGVDWFLCECGKTVKVPATS